LHRSSDDLRQRSRESAFSAKGASSASPATSLRNAGIAAFCMISRWALEKLAWLAADSAVIPLFLSFSSFFSFLMGCITSFEIELPRIAVPEDVTFDLRFSIFDRWWFCAVLCRRRTLVHVYVRVNTCARTLRGNSKGGPVFSFPTGRDYPRRGSPPEGERREQDRAAGNRSTVSPVDGQHR